MNARIRELETALGTTQSQISPQPHPLLAENSKLAEVDAIASLISDVDEILPEETEDEAAELIGAMSIGEQGQTRFHGVSTSSEVFIDFYTPLLVMAESFLNSIFRLYSR